jgi:competence protein ComEA
VDGAAVTSTALSVPADIVVHVAGAVVQPGVVHLPAGSRAEDALAAAGGVAADADTDALNLAAPLRDGDRLYVPHLGQPVPTVVVPSGGAAAGGGASGGGAAATAAAAGPVDLNRATVDQLDSLPGVGPATAAAIVAYRDEHGPFATVDDLLGVRGIGPAKLDAIRALVAV